MVHEYGSLGCSGDLAPLSHVALAVMGEGQVRDADGNLLDAGEALPAHGLTPVVLAEKEGLALINGTDGMLGMLVLALADLDRLFKTADLAAAMSVEGQLGTDRVFADGPAGPAPASGPGPAAANLRAILADSAIVASHRGPDCNRVQDAYSLRCSPQVHGAARDTAAHAATVADRELAAAIDNPVVLPDGRVESNGNFHGAPVGYVLDFLAIAVADLASISERRTDRFLDVARNHGLNAFLADDPGRRQRPHDRAVHAGRDRVRAEAARRTGQRRLDPEQRDAGGPRLDGLVRRTQAAQGDRRPAAGARDRDPDRRAGARPARAARPRRRPPPPSGPPCGSTSRGRAPTGTSRPRSSTPSGLLPTAPMSPPPRPSPAHSS